MPFVKICLCFFVLMWLFFYFSACVYFRKFSVTFHPFFFFLIEKNFSQDWRLQFSLHKTWFIPAFYTVVTHLSIEVAASPEWGGVTFLGSVLVLVSVEVSIPGVGQEGGLCPGVRLSWSCETRSRCMFAWNPLELNQTILLKKSGNVNGINVFHEGLWHESCTALDFYSYFLVPLI